MFLEQQVEQLIQKTGLHDQQIDMLSRGLADLTTDVRAIRHDQTEGFKQMNNRFDALEKEQVSVQEKLSLIVKLLTDRV